MCGRLETRQLLIGLGKMCLAGAVLALVCWAANYWWLGAWSQLRFFPKAMRAAHCNRFWRCGVLCLRVFAARARGAGYRGYFSPENKSRIVKVCRRLGQSDQSMGFRRRLQLSSA